MKEKTGAKTNLNRNVTLPRQLDAESMSTMWRGVFAHLCVFVPAQLSCDFASPSLLYGSFIKLIRPSVK